MFDQISVGTGGMTRPTAPNLPDLNAGKPYPFKKVGGEPEDIFGETEKAEAQVERLARPIAPQNPVMSSAPTSVNAAPSLGSINTMPRQPAGPMTPPVVPTMSGQKGGGNKILTIFVVILFLVAIGLLGWWAYGKFLAKKEAPVENNSLNNVLENLNENLPNLEEQNNEEQNNEQVVTPTTTEENLTVDSDGDGLTDAEEEKLGTNSTRVDSDFDALSDYDEVKIWETNPISPDTDGDTYLDGVEVQNGYNPLGAGKLPTQQDNRILLTPTNIGQYSPGNCNEKFSSNQANTTFAYSNKTRGLSFNIPYNSNWGNEKYKINPYDEYTDFLAFGNITTFEACSWMRLYKLNFVPAKSASEVIAEVTASKDKDLLSIKPYKTTINGLEVVKYQDGGLCVYPTIQVIGKKYNYEVTPLCGNGNDFKYQEDIVKTIKLLD